MKYTWKNKKPEPNRKIKIKYPWNKSYYRRTTSLDKIGNLCVNVWSNKPGKWPVTSIIPPESLWCYRD